MFATAQCVTMHESLPQYAANTAGDSTAICKLKFKTHPSPVFNSITIGVSPCKCVLQF